MKKKETLEHLLVAEMCRNTALWLVQVSIDKGVYVEAMHHQLQYLYWTDEWMRLYTEHEKEYWDLRRATGEFDTLYRRA